MALMDAHGDVVEPDPDPVTPAGLERAWMLVAVAVTEIGDMIGDARHLAGRPDIIEAYRHECHRSVGGDIEFDGRCADNVDIGCKLRRLENKRAQIVPFLIAGEFLTEPDDAIFAA